MVMRLIKFWGMHFKQKKRYEYQNYTYFRYRYFKKFIRKKGKILDFGFGTGYFLEKLAKEGLKHMDLI